MRSRTIAPEFAGLLAAFSIAACGGAAGPLLPGESPLTVCAGGAVQEGVDVSQYQGRIDWNAVHGAGIAFAVARVSDGLGYPDPTFDTNWAGIKAAGMVRGAYQFFEPGEDPVAQANLLLRHIGTLAPGDLPPVIDVEVRGGQSTGTIVAAVQQWIATVQNATGVRPLVYVSPSFWNGLGDPAVEADLWVANWGVSCPLLPGAWSNWKLWQTSDNGHVPGIKALVDTDRFNGTLDELIAYAGGGSGPPPPPPPPPFTVAITAPGDGATISGLVTVTASASAAATGMTLLLDGQTLDAGDTSPLTVSWDTTGVTDGPHELSAQADDPAGNTVTSPAVHVKVNNAPPPLTVAISVPANGATVSGVVTVKVAASAGTLTLSLDGAVATTSDTSALTFSWDSTTAAAGPHQLTAEADDGATVVTAATSVTVRNTAPPPPPPPPPGPVGLSVAITSPATGVTVAGTVHVSVGASPTAARAELFIDGSSAAKATALPMSADWDTLPIADGPHRLTARAWDSAGAQSDSLAVDVMVANGPPQPAPCDGGTGASAGTCAPPASGGCSGTGPSQASAALGALLLLLRRRRATVR